MRSCHEISGLPQRLHRAVQLVLQAGLLWPDLLSQVLQLWAVLQDVLGGLLSLSTRARRRRCKAEASVHVVVQPVVTCAQAKDGDLLWPGQLVAAVACAA